MSTQAAEGEFIATMEDPDDPDMFRRNRIHTNAGAREYGFEGAFVGGVTLYGWCVPTIIDALGGRWLEDGWVTMRFRRPVYPGARIHVGVAAPQDDSGSHAFQALQEDGEAAITGAVGLGTAAWLGDLRPTAFSLPEATAADRPVLTLADAPVGRPLRSYRYGRQTQEPEFSAAAHSGLTELATLDGPVIHPATMARQMISLLAGSYEYGKPSIHAESHIQHLARVPADQDVVLCGTFVAAYERNGHHYAVIDADLYSLAGKRLARLRHTNIFRVRRAAATA